MSTRKRTAEEWPRMKVRGARRKRRRRWLAAEARQQVWSLYGDIWQSLVHAAMAERIDEEARSMHELGEILGLGRDAVDAIVIETRLRTPASPTDWAIARTHLAALAGMTAV